MTELSDSTLEQLLRTHGVAGWDLILIGDGSGSGATQPCGWAVAIIDRLTSLRRLLVGGQNMGSISIAELWPYIMALDHFDSVMRGPAHRKDLRQPFSLNVHIFTDSSYIANSGQRASGRNKHGALWAATDYFERSGYNLTWHWLERGRDTPFLLHKLMDELASEGRSRLKGIEQTIELYELLP